MAAVLAGGAGAVAQPPRGRGTMAGRRPSTRGSEVTVPRQSGGAQAIRFHHRRSPPDELTVRDGIPRHQRASHAARPCRRRPRAPARAHAQRGGGAAPDRRAHPRRPASPLPAAPGSRAVRAALARAGRAPPSRGASSRTVPLPRRSIGAGAPRGERARLEGLEVDAVWRRDRLVVELDGHAAHRTARAFEADRERDRVLQARGWRVVRVTFRHLRDTPDRVAADLRRLLRGYLSLTMTSLAAPGRSAAASSRTGSCSPRSPASATGSYGCRRAASAPAWWCRRWSRASGSSTATSARSASSCASTRTSTPSRSSCSGTTPTSCARRRRWPPRRGPTWSTSTWAARCARSARPAPAPPCSTTPTKAVALARAAARARACRSPSSSGPASGPATAAAWTWRTAWSTTPAWPLSPSTRVTRPSSTRARPTTPWPPSWSSACTRR